MNAVRQLFAGKPKVAAQPAKRVRKGVTADELSTSLAAVLAVMSDCSARQTLERVFNQLDDSDDSVAKLGQFVSLAEFDETLAEVEKFDELTVGTLGPLKRFQALLAAQEKAAAGGEVQHVTVAQMKARDAALFDAFSWAIGAMASEFDLSQPTKGHVLSVLSRSASTPERQKVLRGIGEFREEPAPRRTQLEWLRYQQTGKWS